MKPVVRVLSIVAVLAALVPSLFAQWPAYPSGTVPKDAKGEPDMNAPAPRTADGKPDFSGLWRGAPTGGRGAPAPAAPAGSPPIAMFRNVAQNVPGGLPIQPWAAEVLAKRKADNSKDNPEAHCLPMGLMQFHTQGFPRKFIQTPKLLVILYEASYGIRQIFLDGRPLPDNDPEPWYYGYSTGRWDGDTLVVETNGFRDDGWLDIDGTPMTEKAKMTERFRRVSYGRMEIDITVDDPKAYTKPWTVRHNQVFMPDQRSSSSSAKRTSGSVRSLDSVLPRGRRSRTHVSFSSGGLTSRGLRSSRIFTNTGWRSLPSLVHSVNVASHTSDGFTQCARRSGPLRIGGSNGH